MSTVKQIIDQNRTARPSEPPRRRPGLVSARMLVAVAAVSLMGAAFVQAAPSVTNLFPAANKTVRALSQIEVYFNGPVKGADAADLLVNGTPATNLIVRPGGLLAFQFASRVPGPTRFAWAASHGITDYAATPGAFTAPSPWTNYVDPALTYPLLLITELCAANATGFADEKGLAADWLEIHNPTTNSVDLGGWSLSDDPSYPGQWVFPSRVVAPGERLVVFASAKDIKAPTGTNKFHLNFTLNAGGGFIGLFLPDSPRTLASGFEFPAQSINYSYGIDPAAPPTNGFRYFSVPTPGAPNTPSSVLGSASPVHFSVGRGFFSQAFDLILTTPTPGATIRYATDGSEPTATTGLVYTQPLRIAATTFLRAVAFAPGFAPSAVRTHTYFFNQTAAIMSLPVLSIVTAQANLTGSNGITGIGGGVYSNNVWTSTAPGDYNNNLLFGLAWERPVSAEFIRPEDNGGFQIDCGIRVNGSTFTRPRYTTASKFSYRLYFRNDYGDGKLDYPLFPTASAQRFDNIILRAGHNDISNPFIKDELNRRLHGDMGQPAAQGTFVNLFINGVYKGYYNPTEHVDEESMQTWQGGGEGWDRITVGSVVQEGDAAAWTELRNRFLNPAAVAANAVFEDIASRLDLTNFVDYLLVQIYGANWDWPQNNWRAGRERVDGSRFRFYCWDVEAAFDTGQRQPEVDVWTTTNRVNLSSTSSEIGTFQRGLTNNAEYRLLFADRIQRHFFNGGVLTDGYITNRFLEMRDEMLGVIPTMNLQVITNWVPRRRTPLFSQFLNYGLYVSNAPVLNLHGGRVSSGFALNMIAPHGGTIYCTLNGADPRVPYTGAVAPGAFAWSNALALATSVVVKARTRTGTNWSALTEATFEVATLGVPLRLTEINYNPPGGSAYEFIELRNTGPLKVDLTGFLFDEGITWSFPVGAELAPGAALVLANNTDPAAFAARYPGVQVAGWFSGNLANGGERITLRDAAGAIVFTADYRDDGGWPSQPDGGGTTLEIIDPLGDPDDPANWRASTTTNGTPGVIAPPPPLPPVRLNEIAASAAPDWIELHNASAVDADISGWSLTDDGNARKFVFSTNATIPSGGFLVVLCDTNIDEPGLHSGFALDADGEHVFLYDAATNRVDAVSFGPQIDGWSLGRIEDEWTLCDPTTNAANVAAALASPTNIVINEWLANPPPGWPDWLELHNRAALPVALRGCYLATSNNVHALTAHAFIAPGGFVQLLADEGVGPLHLDFKLSADGDAIAFLDSLVRPADRVSFNAQTEGISRGRLPDGAVTFADFPGTASPGASNYLSTWTGPVFNEVLARRGAFTNAEFIELYNPAVTNFPLAGLSLSVDRPRPGRWRFPPGSMLAPGEILAVWCDTNRPASTNLGDFNLGEALDGDSGGAYLFNAAGQRVTSIEYGPQVAGKPVGFYGGMWRLLVAPTPGGNNTTAQLLGSTVALRLNEWMAASTNGPDWFELFNTTNLPVDLGGLYLTDDPSMVGLTKFQIAPLSFIDAAGWVRFVADNDPEQGRHHASFSLDGAGESLLLLRPNGMTLTLLDTIAFGAQADDVSQGRIPDGAPVIAPFSDSASPGAMNFMLGPPQFATVPTNTLPRLGSNAVFAATAIGRQPIRYEWRRNGELFAGETNGTLIRTGVTFADEGVYEVTAVNADGFATASAELRIYVPLGFKQSPVSQTVGPGERVMVSVVATGAPPPFYFEWRIGTTPVTTNVTMIPIDYFTLTMPSYPTQVNCRAILRNSVNTFGTASAIATLTVSSDVNSNGLPDNWETKYFGSLGATIPGADPDGDGTSNLAEYVAGTDPTNAASVFRLTVAPESNGTVVELPLRPGRTYSVQLRDTAVPATWLLLTNLPAVSTSRVERIIVPITTPNRIYRARTPAQP